MTGDIEAVIVTLPAGVGNGTQIAVTDFPTVDVLVRSHSSMAWERIEPLGGQVEIRRHP